MLYFKISLYHALFRKGLWFEGVACYCVQKTIHLFVYMAQIYEEPVSIHCLMNSPFLFLQIFMLNDKDQSAKSLQKTLAAH